MDFLRIAGLAPRKKGDKKYATFNRRMLAATIDSLLLLPLMVPISGFWFPVRALEMQTAASQLAQEGRLNMATFFGLLQEYGWISNAMAQMVVFFIASGVCWHFWSATPGKMLFRIKIVHADTEAPITDRQIVLRLLGYIPSTVCLLAGFFWIGLNKRRQAWHDKMARTVVVVMPFKKDATPGSPAADPSGSQGPSRAG